MHPRIDLIADCGKVIAFCVLKELGATVEALEIFFLPLDEATDVAISEAGDATAANFAVCLLNALSVSVFLVLDRDTAGQNDGSGADKSGCNLCSSRKDP